MVAIAARSASNRQVHALVTCAFLLHPLFANLLLASEQRPTRGAVIDEKSELRYPPGPFVVDVTESPYNAKGNGISDDTAALQAAINENVGRHKVLYFPAGTYLVSDTLTWPKQWAGRENWGKTMLRGQNPTTTKIRLKPAVFTDPDHPQAMMWCGGFGSADWFHNYVEGFTFDVGHDNPGAVALQFYSNNSGAVRNCRFLAPSGSGVIGLDLGHRDMNGPLLVKDCEIIGFRCGIATAGAVNSQTFEHITLRGQLEVGFNNAGQTISIHDLLSENEVAAVRTYGALCMVDSHLRGRADASRAPAIINYNGGSICLRDVSTTGYQRALADMAIPDHAAAYRITGPDKPGSEGPMITEYWSEAPTSPFPSPARSLRLEVRETPELESDSPGRWANVDDFGADPTAEADSSAAIQAAIDSGATTVFLPGSYALKSTVVIRGPVRRLVGLGGMIDYTSQVRPDFRLADGPPPVVMLEHFASIHGGLEIDSPRTLVLRSVSDCDLVSTARAEGSEIYMEDFVTHDLHLRSQLVWARQLNVENEGTHIRNEGGTLWVLGYKTERGGTLLETTNGGRSEVLGGFSYTTTAGGLAPMFVTNDSTVFTYFREICFNDDPFKALIRETRGGETCAVERGEGTTHPYITCSP